MLLCIWFIGILFLLFEIGSKSARKLLFKFKAVEVTGALNDAKTGLPIDICAGKLGDGIIDGRIVVDKVDDRSLQLSF